MNQDVRSRLIDIVGKSNLLTNGGDTAKFLDEPRKKFHGKALGVVRPGSTQEVSQIVKLANTHDIKIVPQGGNTGLVGGQVPDASGEQLIVSLEKLNAIRNVDADQNTMVLEAGVTLANAQQAASKNDRLFPLSLASEGTCTIGGNLASNAGGLNVVAYGSARDLCLGLEVVLADGRVWNGLNALRKNNTGYDLKNLFIGAEGTLGIITAATLKLFPAICSKATAFVAINTPADALEILNLAQSASGQRVTTIELLPRIGMQFTIDHKQTRDPFKQAYNWYLLLEISSSQSGGQIEATMETALGNALENETALDVVIAKSQQQSLDFWAIREILPETQKLEGASIKHDISVPLAKIPQFLTRAEKAVCDLIPGARPVPFGHVGDGNIHFNITQPVGANANDFLARWDDVNKVVHKIVADLGGSISAEHGIGQLKRHLMGEIKSDVELEMMQGIKYLLDPKDTFNPGKLLP